LRRVGGVVGVTERPIAEVEDLSLVQLNQGVESGCFAAASGVERRVKPSVGLHKRILPSGKLR
jgi:hypothetical protein